MDTSKIQIVATTFDKRFSICTLVSDFDQYDLMYKSFLSAGFSEDDTEFLVVDNSNGNTHDGFAGFNLFLNRACGEFIILCHQDIRIDFDNRPKLETCLTELDEIDPLWAVAGNAGSAGFGHLVARISDPYAEDLRRGVFPSRVLSLDENFILVKNSANLAVSHDLVGFHLYGTDLCLMADILGRTAYAIDFHLRHLSLGSVDERFHKVRKDLVGKYQRAMRPKFIQTMIDRFYLSGSKLRNLVLNRKWLLTLLKSLSHKRDQG